MMKTIRDQDYVHLESCSDDLNSARRHLQQIKEQSDNPLAGAAFCYALIEYARSYTSSEGVVRKNTGGKVRLALDETFVPDEHLDLHQRLLTKRHKLLAHSDLTIREPTLHVHDTQHGRTTGIVKNIVHETEEFDNIDSVIDLIEKTLLCLYDEIAKRKGELSASS